MDGNNEVVPFMNVNKNDELTFLSSIPWTSEKESEFASSVSSFSSQSWADYCDGLIRGGYSAYEEQILKTNTITHYEVRYNVDKNMKVMGMNMLENRLAEMTSLLESLEARIAKLENP